MLKDRSLSGFGRLEDRGGRDSMCVIMCVCVCVCQFRRVDVGLATEGEGAAQKRYLRRRVSHTCAVKGEIQCVEINSTQLADSALNQPGCETSPEQLLSNYHLS
jgi:hypothetical protein